MRIRFTIELCYAVDWPHRTGTCRNCKFDDDNCGMPINLPIEFAKKDLRYDDLITLRSLLGDDMGPIIRILWDDPSTANAALFYRFADAYLASPHADKTAIIAKQIKGALESHAYTYGSTILHRSFWQVQSW